MLSAIRIFMLLPLVVCIGILVVYLVQRLEDKRASPRWRSIATFSFFFALVYGAFAFVFLRQISGYVPHQ